MEPFLALIFEFKITNHFLLIVNRFDWEEWSKIKFGNFCFKVLISKLFSLFSVLILLSILFLCLLYVHICLYSLGSCSCYVLKHVRLLEFLFRSSTMFYVLLGFLGWNSRAHNPGYVHRLDHAHTGLFMHAHDPA